MNIIESILPQIPAITQTQKKFLVVLFSTILLVDGKVDFTNLSRYSCLSEKTDRRHFRSCFNFPQFNQCCLKTVQTIVKGARSVYFLTDIEYDRYDVLNLYEIF